MTVFIGFIKEILTLLRGQQRYSSVFPAQQVLPSGQTVLLSGQDTPETGLSRGRKYRVSQCAMATSRGRRISPLIWRKKLINQSQSRLIILPYIYIILWDQLKKVLSHFLPIISKIDSFYCKILVLWNHLNLRGGGGGQFLQSARF